MNVPLEPPFFPRTIHPASPTEITVNGKTILLDAGDNPFRQLERSNPAEFRKHVENGRRIYYRNCVFCHGDDLGGNGMFVHALDPIPTNFADGATIANLRETFLFWRIAKGGPGLPEEGGPWDTRHAGLGEDPEGGRDVGGRPLPLRLHRRTASRQGGGDAPMTARLIVRGGCVGRCRRVVGRGRWRSLRAQGPDLGTEAQRAAGKQLYARNCAQCHGEKGDGEGYATPHLFPRPRNFTTGKFKVRTTPNGALPTHQDLVNIIRRGMPYTSMPAWPTLSDAAAVGPRLLRQDLLARLRRAARTSRKPVALPSAPSTHGRDRRAGEEAVRRDRLRPMPRHARARRRPVGADAEGRLGSADPRGGPRADAGPSAAARRARTSSGR